MYVYIVEPSTFEEECVNLEGRELVPPYARQNGHGDLCGYRAFFHP